MEKIFLINKHAIKVGGLYLVYKIFLDFVYLFWGSPIYGYMGFVRDISIVNLIISYLGLFAIILIIPKDNKRVSHLILQLHFIIMLIPLTSIYAMTKFSSKFMIMIFFSFALQVILIKNLPLLKLPKIKNAKSIFYLILAFLTFTTYFYLFRTQNINLVALDFTKIYGLRANRNISIEIFSYLITWQFRVINPIIIVLSYQKKIYRVFLVGIGLQFILYLMYPNKEVILSVGLILLCLFIAKKKYQFDSFFIMAISSITILGIAIYETFGSIMLFFLTGVRMQYLPAVTKFWHYDFFLTNEKLYYSEGIIGKILGLNYPYSVPSGFLIQGGFMGNANTGYLAYAYDNAGFLGMIIMTLLFVFVLKLVDSLVKNENNSVVFTLFAYPMFILNDSDLLTSLLTGGLFLLIGLMFVLKNIE
ncbi:hypothetical protein [Tepidibacillus marianensis]|uniref:hypothetical protein n=1 Tax=Tepidibacillus marianensis TaxID=3131995 RepID=UPI0030D516F1